MRVILHLSVAIILDRLLATMLSWKLCRFCTFELAFMQWVSRSDPQLLCCRLIIIISSMVHKWRAICILFDQSSWLISTESGGTECHLQLSSWWCGYSSIKCHFQSGWFRHGIFHLNNEGQHFCASETKRVNCCLRKLCNYGHSQYLQALSRLAQRHVNQANNGFVS